MWTHPRSMGLVFMQHAKSQLAFPSWRERELLSPGMLVLLLVVGLAAFVSYYWVISYKSWNLFDGYGFPFPIYDHLAQSLLQGDVAVPPNVESLYFQEKYFVYFGPFPAFIRMLFNALNPGWFGKAQRFYCLMGALSCWLVALWIFALALNSNAKLSFKAKRRFLALLAIAVAWGSPLFFLWFGQVYTMKHSCGPWQVRWGAWALTGVIPKNRDFDGYLAYLVLRQWHFSLGLPQEAV